MLFHPMCNRTKNLVQVLQYLLIGKSNDDQTKRFQIFLPDGIFLFSILVNFTIYLNCQAVRFAIEIYDKALDSVLATKLRSVQLSSS